MKLFIRRSVTGASRTNPADPNFQFTPGTIGKAIGHHPLNSGLTPAVQANYQALGPTGGINTASPQPGIKFLRNGNWLPFKVNYFRVANGAIVSRKNFGPGTFTYGVNTLYRDTDAGLPGLGAGRAALSGLLSPVAGPVQFMSSPGRVVMFPDKLNLSNGASQNVFYSENSETGQGIWPSVNTTNGFPSASNYLQGCYAIESSWINEQLWLLDVFKATSAAQSCDNANANMLFDNAHCEYYEIEIDDTLVNNISSLNNDVFIVIPVTLARVEVSTVNAGSGVLATDGPRTASGQYSFSSQEIVIPLSYLQAQAAQNIPTEVTTTDLLTAQVFTDLGGNYDINVEAAIKVSFSAQPEIFFLDPIAPGANVGPY